MLHLLAVNPALAGCDLMACALVTECAYALLMPAIHTVPRTWVFTGLLPHHWYGWLCRSSTDCRIYITASFRWCGNGRQKNTFLSWDLPALVVVCCCAESGMPALAMQACIYKGAGEKCSTHIKAYFGHMAWWYFNSKGSVSKWTMSRFLLLNYIFL